MVGCEKGLVKVYSAADFKPLFELQEQKVRVQRRVGCNDIRTHVVVIIPTPPTPQGFITCLAYSENGEWLASGSSDGSLCLWRGRSL